MALGTALFIAGLATQAFGQLKSANASSAAGRAQQDAANAQADVQDSQAAQLDYNAQVADLQAADALQRGHEDEGRFRAQVRGMIGAQRAGFAGQGVDVRVGSAVDVQRDTAYFGELDALKIRANAQREAWGYEQEAQDLRAGADVQRRGAAATRKGGVYAAQAGRAAANAQRLGAAGTVLTGAGSLWADRYGFE